MSGQTREFPEHPNLRFLKLEAKRRLAAGEFPTLHDAQLAVAREHGLPSWAVLKEAVTVGQAERNPATWSSLLPADLAAEAIRPQGTPGRSGPGFGLGWPLHPGRNLAGLVGGGVPGTVASLLIVPGSGRASVVMTSRLVPTAAERVNARLLGQDA